MKRRAVRRKRTAHRLIGVEALEPRTLLAADNAIGPDVVISEIMYHPAGDDPRDEFIELSNVGAAPVQLTGWQLTRGADFAFSEQTLGPGEFLVVVADVDTFAANHPNVTKVVGGWSGQLSNRGEAIELVDASGNVVDRVRYADEGEWAARVPGPVDHGHRGWEWNTETDGDGMSLELINPALPNDYGQNSGASRQIGGTPGTANSVGSPDAAPLIVDTQHEPVLPRSSKPIAITTRLIDESAESVQADLVYRIDGQPEYQRASMSDDGSNGDAASRDGEFTAVIPAQPNGAIIQFHVEAIDAGGQMRIWPEADVSENGDRPDALIQVADSAASDDWQPGDQPRTYLTMTRTERAELADIGDGPVEESASNAAMNGTFIRVDGRGTEIRYFVGLRNRGGSSRVGPPNNVRVDFPHDQPWEGAASVNLNSQFVHAQIVGSAVYRLAGIPAATALPVKVFLNGTDIAQPTGPRMFGSFAQLEVIDADFPEHHFPDDSRGNLYRAIAFGTESADLRYEGPDDEAYRDTYSKRTNDHSDDWSDLIRLTQSLNNTQDAEFVERVRQAIDVEQWLRFLAVDSLLGNLEVGLSAGIGDNYWLYRGAADTRFRLVPHDMDTIMGRARLAQPNRSIFAYTAVAGLERLLTHPDTVGKYYRTVLDLIDTVFNSQTLNPLLDQLLGAFVPAGEINQMKKYVVDRIAGVRAQIPSEFVVSSRLPVVSGFHRTTQPTADLEGTADAVTTRSVLVNGQLANWSPLTHEWSLKARGEGRSETFVSQGSRWRYLDDGSDQVQNWLHPDLDDGAWKSGAAPFGYGTGDEATVVSFGPNRHDKYITTYFRHDFNVADASQVLDLTLRLQYDDAAALYLNGQPIARANLPDSSIDFQTVASRWVGGGEEDQFHSFPIDPSLPRAGRNLLAVEIHQRSAVDEDLRFDLSLEANVGRREGGVALRPGINRVLVQAFDGPQGTGQEVERGHIDVWYDGARIVDPNACSQIDRFGQLAGAVLEAGELKQNTVLAPCGPAYQVRGNVVVPAGVTLTILPGTTVFFADGAQLSINGGRLNAEGELHRPIRMTRPPGSTGVWNGIQFRESREPNVIKHAVLEFGATEDGMVGLLQSNLLIENSTFDHADRFRIRTVSSSLTVRDSVFTDIFAPNQEPTTDNRSEHIWGSGILDGGRLLIEGNQFGTTKGHNDAIDFDGARRPGPIPEIRNNHFAGGGDDALDLETDAHIEGNVFRNYVKDAFNTSTGDANAISAGAGRDYVVVRNVFQNVDHAAQVKDDAFMTFDQNTVAGAKVSAIYFELEDRSPGRGAFVEDSIITDTPLGFGAVSPSTQLNVQYSIVPADGLSYGSNNSNVDPRLDDQSEEFLGLRVGSTARGTGRLGFDLGATVPAGARLAGVPPRVTGNPNATLNVDGPGLIAYRFRANDGPWSEPRAMAEPIVLTNLVDGEYSLFVVGQDSAGIWQDQLVAEPSASWTVDSWSALLRINEVLAINESYLSADGARPDLIELYNGGRHGIDLTGMRVSDDPSDPRKFVFPPGTRIEPDGYLVLSTDPVLGFMSGLGFRVGGQGESVYLYDSVERGGALLDSVRFGIQIADSSIGRLGPHGDWHLTRPTLGADNAIQPTGDSHRLAINEWLTVGRRYVDDDFIEIHNFDELPVDISRLILTSAQIVQADQDRIPELSFIAGGGQAMFLAKGLVGTTADELSFRLSSDQGLLRLFDEELKPIDQLLYFGQTENVAEGRAAVNEPAIRSLLFPTPGAPNAVSRSVRQSSIEFASDWAYEASGADLGNVWYRPEFDDSAWSRGAGVFSGGNASPPLPVGTQLTIGPTTYFFRTRFQVSAELLAAGAVESLELSLLVDDGAAFYLNGQPLLRLGVPEQATAQTLATRGIGVARLEGPFVLPPDRLVPGENVLAVEVHQVSPASTDMAFGMTLLTSWTEIDPAVRNMQALLDGLRITEVMYHPEQEPDAEFIEIQNVGDTALDLWGVRLRGGVEFEFPSMVLRPNQYSVLVRDPSVFRSQYGETVTIAGPYRGQLDNRREEIALMLPTSDTVIQRAGYVDEWYPEADGRGFSLISRAANASSSQLTIPIAWQPGSRRGGTPGIGESGSIPGDFNHDGRLTQDDVDVLCAVVRSGHGDAAFDLDRDGGFSRDDLNVLVEQILETQAGDVNLDGQFDSADLVLVFQADEYEDSIIGNSRWSTGDWDCDGEFSTADLVQAFQDGYVGNITNGGTAE